MTSFYQRQICGVVCTMKNSSQLTLLYAIATSICITSCDLSVMSAGEIYNECSVALHVPDSEKTSAQKIDAARCEKFAERIFYENGYVYVGEEKDQRIQDLKNYFPALWTSPLGGPYVYLVEYWDKNGMSFIDRNLVSAESAAISAFKSLFPKCPEKRAAAGVPVVTKY